MEKTKVPVMNPPAIVEKGRVLLALVFGLLLQGCGNEAPRLAYGEPPPAFTLARLDTVAGQAPSLAFPDALRGQVVAIRFWAETCPYCPAEMEALEPVYRRHRPLGLAILAVNVRQRPETARAFVKKHGISYDVLLDSEGQVARSYGVMGLPYTFFVDREGRLRERILGSSPTGVFEEIASRLLEY